MHREQVPGVLIKSRPVMAEWTLPHSQTNTPSALADLSRYHTQRYSFTPAALPAVKLQPSCLIFVLYTHIFGSTAKKPIIWMCNMDITAQKYSFFFFFLIKMCEFEPPVYKTHPFIQYVAKKSVVCVKLVFVLFLFIMAPLSVYWKKTKNKKRQQYKYNRA